MLTSLLGPRTSSSERLQPIYMFGRLSCPATSACTVRSPTYFGIPGTSLNRSQDVRNQWPSVSVAD
eukprot:7253182-Alexandrium_andersonii.AAC.1